MTPYLVYATAAVIVALVLANAFRRRFDPFAPIWLFLVGYFHVYVVQALSYREYGLRVRGEDLVYAADLRALWALLWFLAVYYFGPARRIARRLPRPPMQWSSATVGLIAPPLVLWGLLCAGFGPVNPAMVQGGISTLLAFPMVMLVAGILLIVTGRNALRPNLGLTVAGVGVTAFYVLIWMFNGKRSHSLIGVLTGICAFYVPRFRRPSKPVLAVTALAGMVAVTLAIGWRGNRDYEYTFAGFFDYAGNFQVEKILVNLNMGANEESGPASASKGSLSHETEEWGGYLLMMDTVPQKADFDYGSPYLRLITTFLPRKLLWSEKPMYGREAWVEAWIAGSEFERDRTFTGPAISILGATQLNGGAVATVLVLGIIAVLLRSAYEYFRLYADIPWVQAWWALTYYNAWLMTVNDNPFIWFYYNYGFTTFGPMTALWLYLKVAGPRPVASSWAPACS